MKAFVQCFSVTKTFRHGWRKNTQWTGASLVQVMACLLFQDKPSTEPKLIVGWRVMSALQWIATQKHAFNMSSARCRPFCLVLNTWAPSWYKDRLSMYGITIINLRRSWDRLIFIIGSLYWQDDIFILRRVPSGTCQTRTPLVQVTAWCCSLPSLCEVGKYQNTGSKNRPLLPLWLVDKQWKGIQSGWMITKFISACMRHRENFKTGVKWERLSTD